MKNLNKKSNKYMEEKFKNSIMDDTPKINSSYSQFGLNLINIYTLIPLVKGIYKNPPETSAVNFLMNIQTITPF